MIKVPPPTISARCPENQSVENSDTWPRGLPESLQGSGSRLRRVICVQTRQLIRHSAFSEADRQDIEQELALEVLKKVDKFDPRRAQLTTFIDRLIKNKATSMIRSRTAAMRDYRRNSASLNASMPDGHGECVEHSLVLSETAAKRHTRQSPRDHLESAQLKEDLASIWSKLSSRQRELMQLLQESSPNAISRRPGWSRRQVAKTKAELRQLFEDEGLQKYL
ncbi:Sigma-70 region 2 [Polystyrenella longa]|uniref:Sigma-70 region 2 n=1 Tax=Polystyrenella longa TaxID=2528007 RepID=A0A518CN28_9PLAN|nr:sigma-70 family RNA polymerase sigma factor [Polystyrenella longa]QDU80630.1 Sigma-70 region 2 [Polystyrenella longa]